MFSLQTFAIAASCFACGFNVLANTAFSREGSAFGRDPLSAGLAEGLL